MKKKRRARPRRGMTVGMLRKELHKTRRGVGSVVRQLGEFGDSKAIVIPGQPPFPSPRVTGDDCLKSIWVPAVKSKRKKVARAMRHLSRDLGRLARRLDPGK